MSIKILREALSQSRRDEFRESTVTRWKAADRYNYAAIKTNVGWFTTAGPGNPFVDGVVDFEGLIEVLSESTVSNIEVATAWEPVLTD